MVEFYESGSTRIVVGGMLSLVAIGVFAVFGEYTVGPAFLVVTLFGVRLLRGDDFRGPASSVSP